MGGAPEKTIEPSRVQVGQSFRDPLANGERGPEMVLMPAGEFSMGSPLEEVGRDPDEGPSKRVVVGAGLSVSLTEITVADFRRFVTATNYQTEAEQDPQRGCRVHQNEWLWQAGISWRDPGFVQTEQHPVVCVSWNDARAYADWLSIETGRHYSLLSEAHWEYAARAGTTQPRFWEATAELACRFANVSDESRAIAHGLTRTRDNIFVCNDGFAATAPAGSFEPNPFGVKDMLGNVWEWTQDCWNEHYVGLGTDGAPQLTGECTRRVYRGGSWGNFPHLVRSASRGGDPLDYRYYNVGFRVGLRGGDRASESGK